MGLVVTGDFLPSPFPISVPSAFPTPSSAGTASAPLGNLLGRFVSYVGRLLGSSQWASPAFATTVTPSPTPGGYIAAYVPLGSYTENVKGIALVPIEGTGVLRAKIDTPDVVNSCAPVSPGTIVSGSADPEAVCVANGTDIYLLSGSKIVATLTSGGSGFTQFSGGFCKTCGVVVDPGSNTGVISIALASGSGYQFLNLAQILNLGQKALGSPVAAAPQVSESFGLLPISPKNFLILSPTEPIFGSSNYQILNVTLQGSNSNVTAFNYTGAGSVFPSSSFLDSGAADSTGIIVGTNEGTGTLFVSDLIQATMGTPAAPPTPGVGSWNAPSQLQNLPEFKTYLPFGSGTTAIAIAYGAHEALLIDEFGTTGFGVIQLPSAGGTGTPAIQDWVVANMPNDPSGASWRMPLDPHGLVAAYVNLCGNKGIGLVMNLARTYIAMIDLGKLLHASRSAPGNHIVDPNVDLLGTGIVQFISIPPAPPPALNFPVNKDSSIEPLSPWDKDVSAIFDHYMKNPYETSGLGHATVEAFTGEIGGGAGNEDLCSGPPYGYRDPRVPPKNFIVCGIYKGVQCSGAGYDPLAYLQYDGHPGYDYAFGYGTPVYPAVSGVVSYCTGSAGRSGPLLSPKDYHTLEIDPKDGSGYRVFYLHLSSYPDPKDSSRICRKTDHNPPDQGNVSCATNHGNIEKCSTCPLDGEMVSAQDRTKPIAYTGDFSNGSWGGVKEHLHFEVDREKPGTGTWIAVDPYGWHPSSAEPDPGDPYDTFQDTQGINAYLWKDPYTCP
jgi:hypothetical protein